MPSIKRLPLITAAVLILLLRIAWVQYPAYVRPPTWEPFQAHWDKELLDAFAKVGKQPSSTVGCRLWEKWCPKEPFLETLHKMLSRDTRPLFGSNRGSVRSAENLHKLALCLEHDTCRPQQLHILIWAYEYFDHVFERVSYTPGGEMVWMQATLDVLDDLGYTIVSAGSYDSFVAITHAMPDLISYIFADPIHVVACQLDPRCLEGLSTVGDMYGDLSGLPYQEPDRGKQPGKWNYTQEELDVIPDSERGKVPLWKLFAVDWWPKTAITGWWSMQPDAGSFSFNRFGDQWTITPFNYPDHMWMPFSVEHTCNQVPPQEKLDQIFVLGKKSEYLYSSHAPPIDSWTEVVAQTGMQLTCTMFDHPQQFPLRDEFQLVGPFDSMGYQKTLGQARVLVGIGLPLISPSPLDAICQATPVVIPVYQDELPSDPWERFSDGYSQNYPVLQLGEPYAYPYRGGNSTSMIEAIAMALANPIQRYILPEQRHESIKARWQWFINFDWEGLAQFTDKGHTRYEAEVLSRCFEKGRCLPTNPKVWQV